MTQLVWLRRDLRLADNPALYHAANVGPVVCVYVLDDESPKHHAYGGASRWWLHHSLERLVQSLEAKGSKLILRRGDAVEELTKLTAEVGAATIHANCHYEPWWLQCRAQAGQEPRPATPPRQLPDGAGQHHHRHRADSTRSTPPSAARVRAEFPPRDELPAPETLTAPAAWPASDDLASWNLLPTKPDWSDGIAAFLASRRGRRPRAPRRMGSRR